MVGACDHKSGRGWGRSLLRFLLCHGGQITALWGSAGRDFQDWSRSRSTARDQSASAGVQNGAPSASRQLPQRQLGWWRFFRTNISASVGVPGDGLGRAKVVTGVWPLVLAFPPVFCAAAAAAAVWAPCFLAAAVAALRKQGFQQRHRRARVLVACSAFATSSSRYSFRPCGDSPTGSMRCSRAHLVMVQSATPHRAAASDAVILESIPSGVNTAVPATETSG